MTTSDRFDVVVALFPFLDIPQRKPRPAFVLSRAAFDAVNGHLIGAMITTGAGSRWPSDVVIADLAAAGLRHRSVVRWKVFTLPFAQVARSIGRLSAADRTAVEGSFAVAFHADGAPPPVAIP